jgi:hypothetical protein
MKKLLFPVAILLMTACALPANAGSRTFSESVPADKIEVVSVDAGVGDVEVAVGNKTNIQVEVILKPRWGGLFSSKKKAQRQVDNAEFKVEIVDGRLMFDVKTKANNQKFDERWTVLLPQSMALDIGCGVGDVTIRGLSGRVSAEAGVGNVVVESTSGDISVDLGVGDAHVTAPARTTGSVDCSSGVGSASLRVRGRRVRGEGFVGNSVEWSGDGSSTIEVEVGVGDSKVSLK